MSDNSSRGVVRNTLLELALHAFSFCFRASSTRHRFWKLLEGNHMAT